MGTNATFRPRHEASTLYLLQARPDRVSVQGFYVDEKNAVLVLSGASGVTKNPKLDLKNANHVWLMYAIVKRLYEPTFLMVDPTVKKRKDLTKTLGSLTSLWSFDIMLAPTNWPSVECIGYRIENARASIGQRTRIFVNNDNPTILNSVGISVIKDQYRCQDHHFDEAEILHHIHADGQIPGVVQIAHSEAVMWSNGTHIHVGNQHKTRIGLQQYGKPFIDLKTPLEALIAIYNLLESESESDAIAIFLTLFIQDSYSTNVFQTWFPAP